MTKIRSVADALYLRHCPGKLNPADLRSRGILASKCKGEIFSLWYNRPEFLYNEKNGWPADKLNFNENVELLVSKEESTGARKDFIVSCLQNLILIENFSNLQNFFRITAYVYRFAHNIKKRLFKKQRFTKSLMLEEIEFVKLQWIKVIQKPLYEDNRYEKQLKQSLGIYFDTNHIVRCKRRLNKSDLDLSSKNPILLPKNEHLILLIIRDQPNMEVLKIHY